MALSKEEILDAISEMSVIDIVDLISAMEEKFGVSAAAPVAVAAPAAGGGDAGARFINTIKRSSLNSQFVFIGIFDDNRKKIGKKIEDVEVLDSILNIKKYSNMFDEIVIALPSSSQKRFNDIYNILLKTDKKILTIPSLKNILIKPHVVTQLDILNQIMGNLLLILNCLLAKGFQLRAQRQ